MADKKERIMDLLNRGIITNDEALTLLENAGLDSAAGTEPKKSDKKTESTTDNAGYTNHKVDTGEAIKSTVNTVADKLVDTFKFVSKKVDDNIDFSKGWPKVKSIERSVEKDITEDFQAVSLDFGAAKVEVKPGYNAHVKIDYKIYGDVETADSYLAENAKLEVVDGVLTISGGKRIGAELKLYLPERQYSRIATDILSGSVSFESVQADELTLKLLNGEIKLDKANIHQLTVINKNGDVKVGAVKTEGLKIESVNGTIKFEGSFVNGDVSLVNGDIRLTETTTLGRQLTVKNVNGDVKLAVPSALGLAGRAKTLFGGYKTRLHLDNPFETTRNGATLVRQGAETLTFELETKSGTIWLKDNE